MPGMNLIDVAEYLGPCGNVSLRQRNRLHHLADDLLAGVGLGESTVMVIMTGITVPAGISCASTNEELARSAAASIEKHRIPDLLNERR